MASTVKIAIIGQEGSGRKTLVDKLQKYVTGSSAPSIKGDSADFRLPEGRRAVFKLLLPNSIVDFKKFNGAIIIYDPADLQTFNALHNSIQQFGEVHFRMAPLLLIGNVRFATPGKNSEHIENTCKKDVEFVLGVQDSLLSESEVVADAVSKFMGQVWKEVFGRKRRFSIGDEKENFAPNSKSRLGTPKSRGSTPKRKRRGSLIDPRTDKPIPFSLDSQLPTETSQTHFTFEGLVENLIEKQDTVQIRNFCYTLSNFATVEKFTEILASLWYNKENFFFKRRLLEFLDKLADTTGFFLQDTSNIWAIQAFLDKHLDDFDREYRSVITGKLVKRFETVVEKRKIADKPVNRRRRSSIFPFANGIPTNIVISDLTNTQIVEHITVIESRLFSEIKISDFLASGWEKSPKNEINYFLARHDELVNWVITEIVKQPDGKKRTATLKLFLKAGDKLREINNYDGAFVIIEALCSAPVTRLQKTWEGLTKSSKQKYETLNELFIENNAKEYREQIAALPSNVNCIPIVHLAIADLRKIENSHHEKEGFVNFAKQQAIACVIHQLQRFKTDFNFKEDAKISAYIQTFKGFDKETAFQMSKIVESSEGMAEETVVEKFEIEVKTSELYQETLRKMFDNWHALKREQQQFLLLELTKKLSQDARSIRDSNLGFVRPRSVIRTPQNIQRLLLRLSESRLEFSEELQHLFSLILIGETELHRSINTFLADIQQHQLSSEWKSKACLLIAESLLKTDESDEIAEIDCRIKQLTGSVGSFNPGEDFDLINSTRTCIKLIEKKVSLYEINPHQKRLTKFRATYQSLVEELQKVTNEFESIKSQISVKRNLVEAKKANIEMKFQTNLEKRVTREQSLFEEEGKLHEEKRRLEEQLRAIAGRLCEITKEREQIETTMVELEKSKDSVSGDLEKVNTEMEIFSARYKDFERIKTFTSNGENYLLYNVEKNYAQECQEERKQQLSSLFKLIAYALKEKYDQAKMLTECERENIPENKKNEIAATLVALPQGFEAIVTAYNLISQEKVIDERKMDHLGKRLKQTQAIIPKLAKSFSSLMPSKTEKPN